MFKFLKAALVAAIAFGGIALQSEDASAVPMVDINPAIVAHSEAASGIIEAQWHRGWHGGGWHGGWHRGWHGGGWHGGWHRGWHGGGWRRGGWHGGWHHRHWR
jgi:hypothetical protein